MGNACSAQQRVPSIHGVAQPTGGKADAMTEQEWLVCDDTYKMLAFLGDRGSERKVRLFMTNCCRRSWHLIQDERCRKAIEVAERFAEGQVGDQELREVFIEVSRIQAAISPVRKAADRAPRQSESEPAGQVAKSRRWEVQVDDLVVDACRRAVRPRGRIPGTVGAWAARYLALAAAESWSAGDPSLAAAPQASAAGIAEEQAQCDLVRHIFGNPFRPYLAPASWPSTVVQLATSLNEGQDCRCALHNALLEAGHPQLAEHFHKEKWHPRGCWAHDLLRGKR